MAQEPDERSSDNQSMFADGQQRARQLELSSAYKTLDNAQVTIESGDPQKLAPFFSNPDEAMVLSLF